MQEERKTVKQELISFDTDELHYFFDGVEAKEALQEFTASIEKQLDTLIATTADKCVFYLDTSCDDYGNDVIDGISLCAERPETDEELQQRKNETQLRKGYLEVRERQEYERLQKKYGDI